MRKKIAGKALTISVVALSLAGCYHGVQHLEDLREMHSQTDLSLLYDFYDSCSLQNQRLTLDDIIQIALERNLELQVKATQWQIQHEVATGEKLKMLPSLLVNAEISGRNNNTGSSSKSLVPGIPPAPPSISSEQNVHKYDISAVWNLLDFGLSYYRSRQEVNRALIQKMEYDRQQQNLITDVVRQYWRAISAKKAIEGAKDVVKRGKEQRSRLESQIKKKLLPPIVGLRNQNEILNIEIGLQVYEKEYHTAMAALSGLMGLPPCVAFELAECECLPYELPELDICCLEEMALLYRPELYSTDIEEVIGADEVRVAILQMFPGPELFAGFFYDGNKYLIHNHWLLAGARVSWNLLAIPRHYSHMKLGEYRKDLARANRLALSIGVMTQLHLAYNVYLDTLQQYNLSLELLKTNAELLRAAMAEYRSGKINPADILRYQFEYLLAEISTWKAFGELQITIEAINNALGIPFYFKAECRPKMEGYGYGPHVHPDLLGFDINQPHQQLSSRPTHQVQGMEGDVRSSTYGIEGIYEGGFFDPSVYQEGVHHDKGLSPEGYQFHDFDRWNPDRNLRDRPYNGPGDFNNRGDFDRTLLDMELGKNQNQNAIPYYDDHHKSDTKVPYSLELTQEEEIAIEEHDKLNERRIYQLELLADWYQGGSHSEHEIAWEPKPEPIHPQPVPELELKTKPEEIAETVAETQDTENDSVETGFYEELEQILEND